MALSLRQAVTSATARNSYPAVQAPRPAPAPAYARNVYPVYAAPPPAPARARYFAPPPPPPPSGYSPQRAAYPYPAPRQESGLNRAQEMIMRATAARPGAQPLPAQARSSVQQSMRAQMTDQAQRLAAGAPQRDPYGFAVAQEMLHRQSRQQLHDEESAGLGVGVHRPQMTRPLAKLSQSAADQVAQQSLRGDPTAPPKLPGAQDRAPLPVAKARPDRPNTDDGRGGFGGFLSDLAGAVVDAPGDVMDWVGDLDGGDAVDAVTGAPGALWDVTKDSVAQTASTVRSVWDKSLSVLDVARDLTEKGIGGAVAIATNPGVVVDALSDGFDAVTSVEKGEVLGWVMEQVARPQQYGAEQIGTTAYEFYTGERVPGGMMPSDYLGPVGGVLDVPTRSIYTIVFEAIKAANPNIESVVQQVMENGYSSRDYLDRSEEAGISDPPPQFHGGRAVWEVMQSYADSLPWYLRYPLRTVTDTVSDPSVALPMVAEGGKVVGATGRVLMAADDATAVSRSAGAVLRGAGGLVRYGAEAPDVPFVGLGKGIGLVGRNTGNFFGLGNLGDRAMRDKAFTMFDEFVARFDASGRSAAPGGPAAGGPPGAAGAAAAPGPRGPGGPAGGGAAAAPAAGAGPGGPGGGGAGGGPGGGGPGGPGAAPGLAGVGAPPAGSAGGRVAGPGPSAPGAASGPVTASGVPVSASGRVAPAAGSGSGATARPAGGPTPPTPSSGGGGVASAVPGDLRAKPAEPRVERGSSAASGADGARPPVFGDAAERDRQIAELRDRLAPERAPSAGQTGANVVAHLRQGYAEDGTPITAETAIVQDDNVARAAAAAGEQQAAASVERFAAAEGVVGSQRDADAELAIAGATETESVAQAAAALDRVVVGGGDAVARQAELAENHPLSTIASDPDLQVVAGRVEVDGYFYDAETGELVDGPAGWDRAVDPANGWLSGIDNPTAEQVAGANQAASEAGPVMPGHAGGAKPVVATPHTPLVASAVSPTAGTRSELLQGSLETHFKGIGSGSPVGKFLQRLVGRTARTEREVLDGWVARELGEHPVAPVYGGSRPLDRLISDAVDDGDRALLERVVPVLDQLDVTFQGDGYRNTSLYAPLAHRKKAPAGQARPVTILHYSTSVFEGGKVSSIEKVLPEFVDAFRTHLGVEVKDLSRSRIIGIANSYGKNVAQDIIDLKMQLRAAHDLLAIDDDLAERMVGEAVAWLSINDLIRLDPMDVRVAVRQIVASDADGYLLGKTGLATSGQELYAAHQLLQISPEFGIPFPAGVSSEFWPSYAMQMDEVRDLFLAVADRTDRPFVSLGSEETSFAVDRIDESVLRVGDGPEVYRALQDAYTPVAQVAPAAAMERDELARGWSVGKGVGEDAGVPGVRDTQAGTVPDLAAPAAVGRESGVFRQTAWFPVPGGPVAPRATEGPVGRLLEVSDGAEMFGRGLGGFLDQQTAVVVPTGWGSELGSHPFAVEAAARLGGADGSLVQAHRLSADSDGSVALFNLSGVTRGAAEQPRGGTIAERLKARRQEERLAYEETNFLDPADRVEPYPAVTLADGTVLEQTRSRALKAQAHHKTVLDFSVFGGVDPVDGMAGREWVDVDLLAQAVASYSQPAVMAELKARGIRAVFIPELEPGLTDRAAAALQPFVARLRSEGIHVVFEKAPTEAASVLVRSDGSLLRYLPSEGPLSVGGVGPNPEGWLSDSLVNPFHVVEGEIPELRYRSEELYWRWLQGEPVDLAPVMRTLDEMVRLHPEDQVALVARQIVGLGDDYLAFVRKFAGPMADRLPLGETRHRLERLAVEQDRIPRAGARVQPGEYRPAERVPADREDAPSGSLASERGFKADSAFDMADDSFYALDSRLETGLKEYGEEISWADFDAWEEGQGLGEFAGQKTGKQQAAELEQHRSVKATVERITNDETAEAAEHDFQRSIDVEIDDLTEDYHAALRGEGAGRSDGGARRYLDQADAERNYERDLEEIRLRHDAGSRERKVWSSDVDPAGVLVREGRAKDAFAERAKRSRTKAEGLLGRLGAYTDDGKGLITVDGVPRDQVLADVLHKRPDLRIKDALGRTYTFDRAKGEIVVRGPGPARLLSQAEIEGAVREQRRRGYLKERLHGGGPTVAVEPSEFGMRGARQHVPADSAGRPLPYSVRVDIEFGGELYKAWAPMSGNHFDAYLLEDVVFKDRGDAARWSRELALPLRDEFGVFAFAPPMGGGLGPGWAGKLFSPIKYIRTAAGAPHRPRRYAPHMGGAAAPGPAMAGMAGGHRASSRTLAEKLQAAYKTSRYEPGAAPPPVFRSLEMNDLYQVTGSAQVATYGDRFITYAPPGSPAVGDMQVWQAVDAVRWYEYNHPGWDSEPEMARIAERAAESVGEFKTSQLGVIQAEKSFIDRDAIRRGETPPTWDELRPPKEGIARAGNTKLVKLVDRYLGVLRVTRLGNVVTGVPGAIGDVLGTAWQVMVGGKILLGAERLDVRGIWRMSQAFAKAGREVRELHRVLQSPTMLDVGLEYPRELFRVHGFFAQAGLDGEVLLHRKAANWGKLGKLAANTLVAQRVLDFRAGLEFAARQSTFDGAMRDYLFNNSFQVLRDEMERRFPHTGVDTFDSILRVARGGGNPRAHPVNTEVFGRGDQWSGLFSAGVVKDATGSQDLANTWARELNRAQEHSMKFVNKTLFSYQALEVDEVLRRLTIFHYWLSRATPYHLRQATRNPFLLNGYFQVWQTFEEEARKEDMPPFLSGMFKVLQKDNGVYAAINPLGFIMPLVLFDLYSQEGGFMESAQSLLNPLLSGAMGAMGMTDYVSDFGGTRPLERFLMNFANGLKGEGVPLDQIPLLGKFIDMDSMQLTMPIQDIIIAFTDHANEMLQKAGIGVGDYEAFDRGANEQSQMRTIGFALGEEIYGPIDTWSPETMQLVLGEIAGVLNGTSSGSSFGQELLSRYGQEGLYQALGSLVASGGVVTRNQSRDVYTAEALDLYAGKNTQTNRNAAGIMQMSKVTDPAWVVVNNQFLSLGTPQGRDTFNSYYGILYANSTTGYAVDGQFYSAESIKTMSQTERKALAERWLETTPGAASLLQQQRSARESFLGEHPEYADYRTYRQGVLDKGPDGFVAQMLQISPNFRYFYDQERKDKERFGLSGAALDAEMAAWSYSMAGYSAAIGQPWELGDKILPVYDPGRDPNANTALSGLLGGGDAATGGVSATPSPNGPQAWRNGNFGETFGIDDPFSYPKYVNRDYEQDQAEFQTENNVMGTMYPGNWDTQAGEWFPWADDTWERRDLGINTDGIQYPTQGGTMRLYATFLQRFPDATWNDFLWWNANQTGLGGVGGGAFQGMLSGQYNPRDLLAFGAE